MDAFNIIQNFFTRMRCNFCTQYLEAEGIELLREEKGVYVVNVNCTHCSRQMGIALVGLEGGELGSGLETPYIDPELTEAELERFSDLNPIGYNDVLDAHVFFSELGADWTKHLPQETQQWEIELESESEVI